MNFSRCCRGSIDNKRVISMDWGSRSYWSDIIAPQLYIENEAWWIEVSIKNLLSTKSRQKWICWGAVEDLSTAKEWSRWIEDLSRSYWSDKMLKILAWWIEEAVKNLSRRNPEISMDLESVEVSIKVEERKLDRNESVGADKKLSSLKKMSFSREENT